MSLASGSTNHWRRTVWASQGSQLHHRVLGGIEGRNLVYSYPGPAHVAAVWCSSISPPNRSILVYIFVLAMLLLRPAYAVSAVRVSLAANLPFTAGLKCA